MWETSLSKPTASNCRIFSRRQARLNQRAWWKTATQDGHVALASSKCPARKRRRPPLHSSMARNSTAATSTLTRRNLARTVASAAAIVVVVMAATATLEVVMTASRAGKLFLTGDTLREASRQSNTVRRGVYFVNRLRAISCARKEQMTFTELNL